MAKFSDNMLAACETDEEREVITRVAARLSGNTPKTFDNWLKDIRASGQSAIPSTSAVWEFAAKAGVTPEMVHLCWLEFKVRNIGSMKRYADWRRVFGQCIRGNWYRLWYADSDGNVQLTSQAKILRKTHG
jgi:formylglycine-generating enzyme required for sulfatase activity